MDSKLFSVGDCSIAGREVEEKGRKPSKETATEASKCKYIFYFEYGIYVDICLHSINV